MSIKHFKFFLVLVLLLSAATKSYCSDKAPVSQPPVEIHFRIIQPFDAEKIEYGKISEALSQRCKYFDIEPSISYSGDIVIVKISGIEKDKDKVGEIAKFLSRRGRLTAKRFIKADINTVQPVDCLILNPFIDDAEIIEEDGNSLLMISLNDEGKKKWKKFRQAFSDQIMFDLDFLILIWNDPGNIPDYSAITMRWLYEDTDELKKFKYIIIKHDELPYFLQIKEIKY